MIALVAAGTGGHIYAAKALGVALEKHHQSIVYITGIRPLDYQLYDKEDNVIHLKSKPIKGLGPLGLLVSFIDNCSVFFETFSHIKKQKITKMVGLGGHICGPVLLAGFFAKLPIYIVEQNSVMGLTNKLLSYFCRKIFTHFSFTYGLNSWQWIQKKVIVSGNPIRSEFIEMMAHYNRPKLSVISADSPSTKTLKILVFGGSLGAKEINDFIHDYLKNYQGPFHLEIRHQCKSNQPIPDLNSNYVQYNAVNFFDQIWLDYQWADFIIARAGASTLSELYFVQKPVLLIPYPHHKDNHQEKNAQLFSKKVQSLVFIHSIFQLRSPSMNLFNEILEKVANAPSLILKQDSDLQIPQEVIIQHL